MELLFRFLLSRPLEAKSAAVDTIVVKVLASFGQALHKTFRDPVRSLALHSALRIRRAGSVSQAPPLVSPAMADLCTNAACMPTGNERTPLFRSVICSAATWIAIGLTGLAMLAVGILTLFQARRFNSEVIARTGARAVLRIWGVRLEVHQSRPFPRSQTVYVANHTSSLDVFVIIALGLPKTRYFMKGYVRRYLPVGLVAFLTGTFFTVPQEYPDERRRIFRRAEQVLRQTGDSVFLTPEGKITLTGEIGPFNKGAFHLATNLRAPIVPFYIQIPRKSDPRDGFMIPAPGVVQVMVQEPISTANWDLQGIEQNRDRVRDLFVDLHKKLKPK